MDDDEPVDMIEFLNRATIALHRLMKIGDIILDYGRHHMSAEVAMANIEDIYLGKEDQNG